MEPAWRRVVKMFWIVSVIVSATNVNVFERVWWCVQVFEFVVVVCMCVYIDVVLQNLFIPSIKVNKIWTKKKQSLNQLNLFTEFSLISTRLRLSEAEAATRTAPQFIYTGGDSLGNTLRSDILSERVTVVLCLVIVLTFNDGPLCANNDFLKKIW